MRFMPIFFVMIFSMNSQANIEGQWTHGGDPIIGSVHEAIARAHKELERLPPALLPSDDFAMTFMATYQKTEIILKDSLKWNDQDVTAINYPWTSPAKVEFSSQRWSLIMNDPLAQRRLVLHELLFLMKIDDTRYEESTRLDSLINFYSQGDLKSLLMDAFRLKRLYSRSSEWSSYLHQQSRHFKNSAEALMWLSNEGYLPSEEWLLVFTSVLQITPLRVCNLEAAQAYLTLMLQGDLISQVAIEKMARQGFSLNPSINSHVNYCAP